MDEIPPADTGGPRSAKRRARYLVLAVVVVVAAAAVGVALGRQVRGQAALASATQVGGPSQTSPHYPGTTVLPFGVAKPSVTLLDTSSRPFDLTTDTRGRLTLLYFGYTHCPDVCPISMALTAAALARLPAAERSRVSVVFITTDPTRDTPSVLRSWLDNFDGSFIGLGGPIELIQQAEKAVGMPLSQAEPTTGSGYEVVHAGYTLIYAQDGTAHLQVSYPDTPANLAKTLSNLLESGYQAN